MVPTSAHGTVPVLSLLTAPMWLKSNFEIVKEILKKNTNTVATRVPMNHTDSMPKEEEQRHIRRLL